MTENNIGLPLRPPNASESRQLMDLALQISYVSPRTSRDECYFCGSKLPFHDGKCLYNKARSIRVNLEVDLGRDGE